MVFSYFCAKVLLLPELEDCSHGIHGKSETSQFPLLLQSVLLQSQKFTFKFLDVLGV